MRELFLTLAGQQGAGKTTILDLLQSLINGRTSASMVRRDNLATVETAVIRIPNQADFVRDARLRKVDTSATLYRALKALHHRAEEQRTRLGDDLPETGPGRELFDQVTEALRLYEESAA